MGDQSRNSKLHFGMGLYITYLLYTSQMAVNNVSLNIRRNSVYGLLGPNGAGKSTILKMLTGILRPTSGSIEFDGHPWKRNDLEHIGALIEMPPLYENPVSYTHLNI